MKLQSTIVSGAILISLAAGLANPSSAVSSVDCSGCAVSGTAAGGGSGGGWTISVSLTSSSGTCLPFDETCAPSACTGTAVFTVSGPPNTTYYVGYQTSNSPHYTQSPAPHTDADGNGSKSITQRAPCGGTVLLDCNGPNGEAYSYGAVDCSGCIP